MLMGIVFLNLVFVHITKAVSLSWLLPLYALTLAGPYLTRFHDHLVYRVLWNLAVVAIFGLLVNHATDKGVHYLLEDGLILAALCQVHLFNNLRKNQQPDLLFFNSFLIALVTSFFCQELIYCVVFMAYVLLVIPTVQLYVVLDPTKALDRPLAKRIVRDSLPRSLLALSITGLVFFFCPRDFYRDGWVTENMQFAQSHNLSVGFSEDVRLGRYGEVRFGTEEVLRITVKHGRALVPQYWRGATFLQYSFKGWFAEQQFQAPSRPNFDPRWTRRGSGKWAREERSTAATLRVELNTPSTNRLFLPLQAGAFHLAPSANPEYVGTLVDGTVVHRGMHLTDLDDRFLVYEIEVWDPTPEPLELSTSQLGQLTSLNRQAVPQIAYELARTLNENLSDQHTDLELVEAYRSHLAQSYNYMLPGAKGGASGLADFLRGNAGGHCEYFATALAVLLRTQGIPCRLVTGFLATEWDEEGTTLIAREKDAHAWVEVLNPDTGWYVVDPSPSVAALSAGDLAGLWQRMKNTVEELWAKVTGFDSDGHAAALRWLRSSPRRLVTWIAANPWTSAFLTLLCASFIAWKRHRALRLIPFDVRVYRTSLKRAKLIPLPGETPRELLSRALRSKKAGLDDLTSATIAHEAQRYARR